MRCRQCPRRRETRGCSGDGDCLIRYVVRRVGQLGDVATVTATERCRSWAAMSSISTRVPTNPVVLSSSATARACARDSSCTSRRTRRTVTRLASGSISRSRAGPCSVKSAWRISSGVAPPLSFPGIALPHAAAAAPRSPASRRSRCRRAAGPRPRRGTAHIRPVHMCSPHPRGWAPRHRSTHIGSARTVTGCCTAAWQARVDGQRGPTPGGVGPLCVAWVMRRPFTASPVLACPAD